MKEINIIDVAQGEITNQISYELQQVIENIKNTATKACAKRKIVVTLELVPDENREYIVMQTVVKSALQPTQPINSIFCLTDEGLIEATAQAPGQFSFDGDEEGQAKLIQLKLTEEKSEQK